VLDVPCGQGRHAHLLAESGYDVDGLDYSKELLEVARKRGTGKTLRYTRGDMRAMPNGWTKGFDAVLNLFTSFGFFAHPSDDVRVIKEFARVLKPGGTLTVHSTWRKGLRKGNREHRLRLYTATRLAEMCSDAGLIVEQAYDGFNDRPLRRTSSEMLLVARKE